MQELAWLAKLIKENYKVVIQAYSLYSEGTMNATTGICTANILVDQLCTYKTDSEHPSFIYYIAKDSDLNDIINKEERKLRNDKGTTPPFLLSIIYKKEKNENTTMEVRTDLDLIYKSEGENCQ